MKSKDVKYLKYFAKQCLEKIENRKNAPEKTRIDRGLFCYTRVFSYSYDYKIE